MTLHFIAGGAGKRGGRGKECSKWSSCGRVMCHDGCEGDGDGPFAADGKDGKYGNSGTSKIFFYDTEARVFAGFVSFSRKSSASFGKLR